ncbi:MAG: hypothetical protein ACLTBR_04690 [Anaerostipes sp.]|uniref:hypothetical protein n=1 Tax=Anaerostipes sp. TaxID=1872530 RepID=UPI003991792D
MKKKKILFVMIGMLLLTSITSVLIFLMQRFQKIEEIERWPSVANVYERNMGDCILFRKKNKIFNFPFIFGERLCLYDINKGKYYSVAMENIPFYTFGSCLAVNKEKVYFNTFGAEENSELYSKNISGIGIRRKVLNNASLFSADDSRIYYLKDSEVDEDESNPLYVKNLKTGKSKKITEGAFVFVLRRDQDCLYTFDNRTKEVCEISLNGKKQAQFTGVTEPTWIGRASKDEIIVMEYNNILLYNKKTKEKRYYEKNISKHRNYIACDQIHIKNKKCYYVNNALEGYEIDLSSGSKKKIFSVLDMEKYKKAITDLENVYIETNYCNSYIVIDLFYDSFEREDLIIYSYDGKLKEVFKLR